MKKINGFWLVLFRTRMTKEKTAERLFFLLEASSVFLKRQRSGGSNLIRPLAPPGADEASGRIRQWSKFAAEPAKRNKFRVPQRVVTPHSLKGISLWGLQPLKKFGKIRTFWQADLLVRENKEVFSYVFLRPVILLRSDICLTPNDMTFGQLRGEYNITADEIRNITSCDSTEYTSHLPSLRHFTWIPNKFVL